MSQGLILDKTIKSERETEEQDFDPFEAVYKLLKKLKRRPRQIIISRFNLNGEGFRTLESIGRKLGITRERVRQIEGEALNILKKKICQKILAKVTEKISDVFSEHGNIIGEKSLLSLLISKRTQNIRAALLFILQISPLFKKIKETDRTYEFWVKRKTPMSNFDQIIKLTQNILEKEKKVLPREIVLQRLERTVYWKSHKNYLKDKTILSFLDISKDISVNPFGDWGLSSWREIMPKGVRDKCFIIAKKYKKPLHFTLIANLINKAKFDSKKALPQTIHNELIKDERFVLVGRGIYVLRSQRYRPGTTQDVIINILKRAKKPVLRDELVRKVKMRRLVKRNTILLNLQNKRLFKKIKGDRYVLVKE